MEFTRIIDWVTHISLCVHRMYKWSGGIRINICTLTPFWIEQNISNIHLCSIIICKNNNILESIKLKTNPLLARIETLFNDHLLWEHLPETRVNIAPIRWYHQHDVRILQHYDEYAIFGFSSKLLRNGNAFQYIFILMIRKRTDI